MSTQAKCSIIYLEPELFSSLRTRAAETSCSITDLVNEAVREFFAEEAENRSAFDERNNEAQIHFDKMVEQLKRDGVISIVDATMH